MNLLKRLFKWSLYILLIPILYGLISFILLSITVNGLKPTSSSTHSIYIKTNGVHLDLILPKTQMTPELLSGVNHHFNEAYLAFGWGDENFYINTPTWDDLTMNNAFSAIFLKSTTLMHVTRYTAVQSNWIKIKVTKDQLEQLNAYILNTFKKDENGNTILLKNKGYSAIDNFYKANGSYSFLNTCNTWVNTGLKESGLKACYWTPFDFGLLNKYE